MAFVIQDMLESRELESQVTVDDVLKDLASVEGYKQLVARGAIPGVRAGKR